MANRYWVGGTDTWNSTAGTKWASTSGGAGGQAVPTFIDDVYFDANSGTVDVNLNSGGTFLFCYSFSTAGFTGNLTNTGLPIGLAGTSLTLGTGQAFNFSFTIVTSSRTVLTTFNGSSIQNINLGVVNGSDSSQISLQDDMVLTGSLVIGYSGNTATVGITTNNHNLKAMYIQRLATQTGFNFSMGSSTIEVTGSSAFDMNSSTGLNIIAGSSTIKYTNANPMVMLNFRGGNATYYNLWATVGVNMQDSNTFNDIKINAGRTINFIAGTTQVISSLTAVGTAANLINLRSSSSGVPFTISKSSGAVNCNYLSLQDSTVSGGATFYAGRNSVNISGNTGWKFKNGTLFTNPQNAYADDASYATVTAPTGIISVVLSKNAGVTWTSPLTTTFTGTETINTLGAGATELWGSSWIGTDVNNTNFRIGLYIDGTIYESDYKTFGFTAGTYTLTGIEAAIKAKWDGTTTSINHIKVKIYYGTSTLPIQAGSQAFASNGRKAGEGAGAGTGLLVYYDGANWIASDTGATVSA